MTDIEIKYVKNIYEEIAPYFSVTRVYTWKWISDFLNNFENNSLIYDIGCGNGRNMIFDNLNMIGIDNCEKFVKMCNDNNKKAILYNITDINLPSNSADGIICIAVLHHLSNYENRKKALYEMKRLIKPFHTILLSVWSKEQPEKTRIKFENYGDNFVNWNNQFKRYYYIFKISELLHLFNICGLTVLEHKYDCGNEIFLLTKLKYQF